MEEGASPPRWALDNKLGEDASIEEKKEGEKERGGSTKLKEEKGREFELWVVSHKTLIHQSYNKCHTKKRMEVSVENAWKKSRTLSHETIRGRKKILHNWLVNKQILEKDITVSPCLQIT